MLDGSSLHAAALWLMIAYCAAPGAVNAESFRRGLRGGFTSAILVQLGAVAGRVLWAAIALAGSGVLAGSGPVHAGLAALGAILLLRASWHALAAPVHLAPAAQSGSSVHRGDFTAGLLISLTNPFALVFWTSVIGALGLETGGGWDVHNAPMLLATLMAAAFAWSAIAAAAIALGRRAATIGTLRLAEAAAGLTLGIFGVQLLWETAGLVRALALR